MKGEFEFIQNIKKTFLLEKVGDDCAVLPKDDETDMVVTTDMLVEDIDFRLEWTTAEFLGHKVLGVSLSDIAAMGASPKWAMLSIGIPEKIWKEDFVERFYNGWHDLAHQFEVELIGGDVSRTPDKLVIDSICGGEVPRGKAIVRSGAKVGDVIYVSGKLGGAAGGLALLERGIEYRDSLPETERNLEIRQLRPIPRVKLGNNIQKLNVASSMIDISDGLAADLAHICAQSSVGAALDFIPVDENLTKIFGDEISLDHALHGGEDFELLFTVAKQKISLLDNLNVIRIGAITSNVGIIELIRGGRSEILQPKGYRHF